MRVLVVEDDDGVADALADGLRQHHIRTARAATAAEGLAAAATADLVLIRTGCGWHGRSGRATKSRSLRSPPVDRSR